MPPARVGIAPELMTLCRVSQVRSARVEIALLTLTPQKIFWGALRAYGDAPASIPRATRACGDCSGVAPKSSLPRTIVPEK